MTINGVGELTASAVVAATGDAKQYKNARQFSASLGLVPRQHSTGGKPRLLGISKKGDRYIRKLLVHGARSTVRHLDKKVDKRSMWLKSLIERRGVNKAVVAMANKNARVIWVLMVDETRSFDPNHLPEGYQEAA